MRNAVTRRQFLACAISIGASTVAGDVVSGGRLTVLLPTSSLGAKLSDVFAHKESARAIGVEYLKTHTAETDEHVLVALISAKVFENDAIAIGATEPEVKQLLHQSIRRDFESDQIVQVQGWILSVTEARLCALTTLT